MKRFLALAALLIPLAAPLTADAQGTTPAVASPQRAARIARAQEALQAKIAEAGIKGGKGIVEDTGQDVDLGAGPGPLIVIKIPAIGRKCLVGMHPTEELYASLMCEDGEPETDI